jgi:cytochrome b6-f complex iron-sulfur subunit
MVDRMRRKVTNWLVGLSGTALGAVILYPVTKFLTPPLTDEAMTSLVDAGAVNDPEFLDKRFKIIRFGSDPVIVLRVAENDFRAFSAVCTHLDCIVDFRKDRNLIWCWCHNGIYDLNGINIGGPPPRPLPPYRVALAPGEAGGPPSVIVLKA